MTDNHFLAFLKSVGDPRKALLVFDVDLAIQPSMSTETTALQKQHMWELYERTDGGVLFFTGRTPQSVNKTFGHDYAGVFEHYSMARFGHGQSVVYMAPEIDIAQVGRLAQQKIEAYKTVAVVADPAEIGKRDDLAVFVEMKNTSVALVHTLKKDGDDAAHLREIRSVLRPVGEDIIRTLQLQDTHEVKTGGDAVEIVPKGLSANSQIHKHLTEQEIQRIHAEGLSKATAIHNFQTLFGGRRTIVTGDSKPDLEAMVEIKKYDGKGIYVSNGIPHKDIYNAAVDGIIPHHTMTWPLITATAMTLRDAAPIVRSLPPEGGMVPNLSNLQ